MSDWLSLLAPHLSKNEPLLIAVICEFTGASPDRHSGVLAHNGKVAVTNIINDSRRTLILKETRKQLLQSNYWSDVTYPLGKVMSSDNGACRIVYQYFDPIANKGWFQEAQTVIRTGKNIWLAFEKEGTAKNSAVSVLTDPKSVVQSRVMPRPVVPGQHNTAELEADESALLTRARLDESGPRPRLLLPVTAPVSPIVIVGRHRVAIAAISQLALLPVAVNWVAEKFLHSDPSGPLIKQIVKEKLSFENHEDSSIAIVMSEDHERDLDLCEQALMLPSMEFVGCIGSLKKANLLKSQLRINGVPKEQLNKLCMPIGLPQITGKHPAIISASVVAQILSVRKPGCDDQLTLMEI